MVLVFYVPNTTVAFYIMITSYSIQLARLSHSLKDFITYSAKLFKTLG